jgi:SAM-dependent methyltransferase
MPRGSFLFSSKQKKDAGVVAPSGAGSSELPLPPLEMRQLVGQTDPDAYDNPTSALIFDFVEASAFRSVFDFGCGCGRLARQLIQQRPRPERYLGVDLHAGMIAWCQRNLAPFAPGFEFLHHNEYNYQFNPGGVPQVQPFPAGNNAFSLVEAWSVFTHLTEEQTVQYLAEAVRVLAPGGVIHSTWFLFDKSDGFPMMTQNQNALYVSHIDPSAAVLYDRSWLRDTAAGLGLEIYRVWPVVPAARGFQWHVLMASANQEQPAAAWPADDRPAGSWNRPPDLPERPTQIGLDAQSQEDPGH